MNMCSYDNPVCGVQKIHAQALAKARKGMRPEKTLFDLAELFKVMGDHTRVRILDALSVEELCVCDLAELLEMSHSAVSHQLRCLRSAKVVKFRKMGKKVFYSLDDQHVINLFSQGLDHVNHG